LPFVIERFINSVFSTVYSGFSEVHPFTLEVVRRSLQPFAATPAAVVVMDTSPPRQQLEALPIAQ